MVLFIYFLGLASQNFRKIQIWLCFSPKQSQLKELCLLKYPWDIHTLLKIQYCHSVITLKWLLCICVVWCFKNFDTLQISGGMKFLCSYTLICIQHWSWSPWNEVCQIKYYFCLPDRYFLPHIGLLPQHLQDFVLQFIYSICFSFFPCWICLENEFKP